MIFLGIDGGGTKTAFSIMDEKGRVLAKEEKGTIHLMQISQEEFKNRLEEGISEVLQKAKAQKKDIGHSFIGIPGFGEYVEKKEIAEKIVYEVLGKNTSMGNDSVAGWAGSLGGNPGINVVVGTGSIAYGVDPKGNHGRSGGWGPYFGDEASAYWFGKRVLEIFSKESDGRYEKNAVYHLVKDKFQPVTDFQMIEFFYSQMEDERQRVAQLAPILSEGAKKGDPYAIGSFQQGAEEIGLCVFSLINKLDFKEDETIQVSLSGGVTKSWELLSEPLKKVFSKDRRIELKKSILEPWQGALLMAYREYTGGISPEVIEELEKSWQV